MTGKKITFWLIVLTAALWIVWDIIVAAVWGNEATESVTFLQLGHAHPIIPFAAGVLTGHFWWSQKVEGKVIVQVESPTEK